MTLGLLFIHTLNFAVFSKLLFKSINPSGDLPIFLKTSGEKTLKEDSAGLINLPVLVVSLLNLTTGLATFIISIPTDSME